MMVIIRTSFVAVLDFRKVFNRRRQGFGGSPDMDGNVSTSTDLKTTNRSRDVCDYPVLFIATLSSTILYGTEVFNC